MTYQGSLPKNLQLVDVNDTLAHSPLGLFDAPAFVASIGFPLTLGQDASAWNSKGHAVIADFAADQSVLSYVQRFSALRERPNRQKCLTAERADNVCPKIAGLWRLRQPAICRNPSRSSNAFPCRLITWPEYRAEAGRGSAGSPAPRLRQRPADPRRGRDTDVAPRWSLAGQSWKESEIKRQTSGRCVARTLRQPS